MAQNRLKNSRTDNVLILRKPNLIPCITFYRAVGKASIKFKRRPFTVKADGGLTRDEFLPDDLTGPVALWADVAAGRTDEKRCDGKSTTTAEILSQRDTKSLHATLTSPQTFKLFFLLLP